MVAGIARKPAWLRLHKLHTRYAHAAGRKFCEAGTNEQHHKHVRRAVVLFIERTVGRVLRGIGAAAPGSGAGQLAAASRAQPGRLAAASWPAPRRESLPWWSSRSRETTDDRANDRVRAADRASCLPWGRVAPASCPRVGRLTRVCGRVDFKRGPSRAVFMRESLRFMRESASLYARLASFMRDSLVKGASPER